MSAPSISFCNLVSWIFLPTHWYTYVLSLSPSHCIWVLQWAISNCNAYDMHISDGTVQCSNFKKREFMGQNNKLQHNFCQKPLKVESKQKKVMNSWLPKRPKGILFRKKRPPQDFIRRTLLWVNMILFLSLLPALLYNRRCLKWATIGLSNSKRMENSKKQTHQEQIANRSRTSQVM